eukprot:gene4942-8539_t
MKTFNSLRLCTHPALLPSRTSTNYYSNSPVFSVGNKDKCELYYIIL